MTFLEAAYEILKEAGQPLHYREITHQALDKGLIRTSGKTPAATMRAQIGTSIRRAAKGGPPSPFYKAGRAIFGLTEWQKSGIIPSPPYSIPTTKPRRPYLTYKQAAQKILREAGQPLHYREIARRAVDQELINPQGLTPDATMGAQLYSDIKQHGTESAFRRESRGIFALAEWDSGVRGIVRQATRQRREVKKKLLLALRDIKADAFEQFVGRLLGVMGYENIEVTRRSGDIGVDVLAEIEVGVLRLHTTVQVKRLKGNVQRPAVSQLRGDMALWDVDQGMIITTGGFSAGAKQVARLRNVTPITLIDGDRLTDLLIEHGIGVRKEAVEVVTSASERLEEEEL
jgi:restriction system protein